MAKNKKRNNNQKKNNAKSSKTPYPRTKRGQIVVNVTSGLIIFLLSTFLLSLLTMNDNSTTITSWGNAQYYEYVVLSFGEAFTQSAKFLLYWITWPFRFFWKHSVNGMQMIRDFLTR